MINTKERSLRSSLASSQPMRDCVTYIIFSLISWDLAKSLNIDKNGKQARMVHFHLPTKILTQYISKRFFYLFFFQNCKTEKQNRKTTAMSSKMLQELNPMCLKNSKSVFIWYNLLVLPDDNLFKNRHMIFILKKKEVTSWWLIDGLFHLKPGYVKQLLYFNGNLAGWNVINW